MAIESEITVLESQEHPGKWIIGYTTKKGGCVQCFDQLFDSKENALQILKHLSLDTHE